jgi:hypothetical protein
MRKWTLYVLIAAALLSGCIVPGGRGFGGRGGFYHSHDWR